MGNRGIQDFNGLGLGEQMMVEASILSITLDALNQRVMKTNDIVDFQRINRVLDGCIPEIIAKGGIVLRFGTSSSMSLFPQSPEDALSCALSIFAVIEEMPRERKKFFDRVSLAICHGNVTVGMVGFPGHYVPMASSEEVLLCRMLQKRASTYYARILATGTFFRRVHGAVDTYNHRILGDVYLSGSQKTEVIYDVFEADEPEIRNLKRRTKNMFEKGVEMYRKRRFAEARSYFLEVIRTDRRDLAAREYLLRCDDFIHGTKDSRAEEAVYFEIL